MISKETTRATSEVMLHQNSGLTFFGVKRREWCGALKRKSCLSEASSFSLAEHPTGVAKKVQPALFLCFVSFVRTKEMKNISNIPHLFITLLNLE